MLNTSYKNLMLFNLIFIELKKYKRTVLPWMIAAGGLLTSGTAIMIASTGNRRVSWETYTVQGFSFMNLLALLLVAVFTGFVFTGESSHNIDNIIFTYPVSRIRFFLAKLIVILLYTILLYLAVLFFEILLGFLVIGSFPGWKIFLKMFEISLILSAANYILVPVTTFITILVKGSGTYLFTGMAYFILYISFTNTDINRYVPVCQPDKLLYGFFSPEIISGSEIFAIITVCSVTFLSAFIISVNSYTRQDVCN